jgi:hypothetical protein
MIFESIFRDPPTRLATEVAGYGCAACLRRLARLIPDSFLKLQNARVEHTKPCRRSAAWSIHIRQDKPMEVEYLFHYTPDRPATNVTDDTKRSPPAQTRPGYNGINDSKTTTIGGIAGLRLTGAFPGKGAGRLSRACISHQRIRIYFELRI